MLANNTSKPSSRLLRVRRPVTNLDAAGLSKEPSRCKDGSAVALGQRDCSQKSVQYVPSMCSVFLLPAKHKRTAQVCICSAPSLRFLAGAPRALASASLELKTEVYWAVISIRVRFAWRAFMCMTDGSTVYQAPGSPWCALLFRLVGLAMLT